MASSSPSAGPTYSKEDLQKTHANEFEEADEQSTNDLRQIDQYIDECRQLYKSPLISERTRDEYEKDWQKLRAERNLEYMRGNVRFLYETISAAQDYEAKFKSKLEEAVDKKWIGKKSRDNWMKRFNKGEVLEWDRKKWVTDEFPEYARGWEETANVRKEVWALAKKLGLKENKIPELKGIMKIQQFLALPFNERKNKVYAAKAALVAYERKLMPFFDQISAELRDAGKQGTIHKSKIGKWLKRVMDADNPMTYANEILRPFMKNWADVRSEFDSTHREMRKNDSTPRGLRVLNPNAFLMLDYEQRLSYVHEVKLRMNEKEELDPALDSFKKRIRHSLDTQDWDEAAAVLSHAQHFYPYDEDLDSMKEFLRTHASKKPSQQAEKKETPDPMGIADNLRSMLSQMPEDVQWMYINAMRKGPRVFGRLLQLMYNRVWVYEHNFGNEQADKIHGESEANKERTLDYMGNGHSRKFERNIIEGDTAELSAIRDDCTKPQVLYMGDQGRETVLEKVNMNAENEKFGYWTTLVPKDLSYAQHRDIVLNYNYKMKTGLRQLDSMGYRFTLTGSLDRKNGDATVPSTKQAAPKPVHVPTYSSTI